MTPAADRPEPSTTVTALTEPDAARRASRTRRSRVGSGPTTSTGFAELSSPGGESLARAPEPPGPLHRGPPTRVIVRQLPAYSARWVVVPSPSTEAAGPPGSSPITVMSRLRGRQAAGPFARLVGEQAGGSSGSAASPSARGPWATARALRRIGCRTGLPTAICSLTGNSGCAVRLRDDIVRLAVLRNGCRSRRADEGGGGHPIRQEPPTRACGLEPASADAAAGRRPSSPQPDPRRPIRRRLDASPSDAAAPRGRSRPSSARPRR